ncbi:hypothetical protein HELRODRAFT_194692 [Helobdella robusta]|uniref:SEA domain-containing protein n=1 Tax=Helobdella robusta TaxID=6412 RepID=T1FWB7_HELRO|nr:hypothetical protein HELRODRAFT_194692 [Helobdella robusta]ESN90074.1 hypothetical protein HELRODRAFT_194692 [Helobdella robusta]
MIKLMLCFCAVCLLSSFVTSAENDTKIMPSPNLGVTTPSHTTQQTTSGFKLAFTSYAASTSSSSAKFSNNSRGADENRDVKKSRQNISLPCLNWCRFSDVSLDECWNQSLKYHTNQLKISIANFYSALLHVNRWKVANEDDSKDSNNKEIIGFERAIVEEILNAYHYIPNNPDVDQLIHDDEEVIVNETTTKHIFNIILDEYNQRKHHYEEDETGREPMTLPSLPCPITCEYYPKIWVTLTFVTSLSFILLTTIVFVYFFYDVWLPMRKRFRPVSLIG